MILLTKGSTGHQVKELQRKLNKILGTSAAVDGDFGPGTDKLVKQFQKKYNLTEKSSVLDVGAAKGFMLFDFQRLIPKITVAGCDISDYAIKNAKEEVKPFLKTANATHLPYKDDSFDLVISINTVHNLEKPELTRALQEIERVSRGNSFITVDAYRSEEEKELMYYWNLTAKTIMHVDKWRAFFNDLGYTGDYYWFIP